MIKLTPKNLIVAAALIGISAAAQAQTPGVDMKGTVGYVIDARGFVAKSGTGLCWRTGYWTPAMAIAECDPDLAKKEAPKAAAPAAPAAAVKPAAAKVTLAADALFDFDKAVLKPEGKQALDKLVNDVKGIKLEVIIAVGHADRIGKDAYNQKLSERRAAAVKDYLVGKGIEANRVYSEGKGEKQPKTTEAQCGKSVAKSKKLIDCLQPDRRVEIEVIGTK
jgi:OOP family OmpA-OmpF porin